MSYYLEHWNTWPLPVMSAPAELNPFQGDGVDLSVVLAYHLPYANIKFLTVCGLLRGAEDRGVLGDVHTLVEATSGNTGLVLASLAKAFKIKRVKLVVAPDLPDGKRYPLILTGAELIPPENGFSPIATARRLGGGGWKPQDWRPDGGCLNPDQYGNPDGTKMHAAFTAVKTLEQLPYPPAVFVGGVGTGGTLIGVGQCLRSRVENIKIVGVLLSPGHEIPGVRDRTRMSEVSLPWRESLDRCVEVKTRPSYLASLWFNWVMGITPGPSSGLAYLGAMKFLRERKAAGALDELRDRNGRIHVAILFPDGNRPYGDRFTANLPFEYLKPQTAPRPWELLGP